MTNEIVITVETLLWFLGIITAIGAASAVISKWFAPFHKLKETVASKASQEELTALKKEFECLKNNQNADHTELKKVEIGIEKICKCTLAITDHELTGNSVDKLREAKDEMQDYLIQK